MSSGAVFQEIKGGVFFIFMLNDKNSLLYTNMLEFIKIS